MNTATATKRAELVQALKEITLAWEMGELTDEAYEAAVQANRAARKAL